ncbi:transposase [Vibrio sp. ED004]|nr:transposase [Vibrio sp. ED004]
MIKSIYHEHKGRYGYRRIHLELKNQGFVLNHKTVQRLMAQLNLKSTVRIKSIVHTEVSLEQLLLTCLKEILVRLNPMKNG